MLGKNCFKEIQIRLNLIKLKNKNSFKKLHNKLISVKFHEL